MPELIPAKTIVTRFKGGSQWFGADYNMNIYRGCSHGCIYCDSRSDCYRDTDFERVKVKEDALRIIRDDLRRKVKSGVVATGAMSDPYNPREAELNLTRHAMELLHAFGFGAAIATKSDLITRDIDVFTDIKRQSPVLCKITITTAEDALAAKTEPRAPSPSRRFEAIKKLSGAGIFTGVLLMPTLPFITDGEESVLEVVRRAADCGAKFVYFAPGVTLRDSQREFFYSRLDESFPGLRGKYEAAYGSRYSCASPNAKRLIEAVGEACNRLGLQHTMPGIIRAYKYDYTESQMSLF